MPGQTLSRVFIPRLPTSLHVVREESALFDTLLPDLLLALVSSTNSLFESVFQPLN